MTQSAPLFKLLKRTVLFSLLLGTLFASCKKSTPAIPTDKTTLQAKITVAQGYSDNSLEGTKPGQYEVGSKVALNVALAASKLVLADPNASQTTINAATANLQGAIDVYLTHFIKEIAAANLIGFWKFNGNPNDSSGKGNNGVVTVGHAYYGAGTPTLTADRFARANMAYHFDKGGNIEVPYSTTLNPVEMTISLWAKKSIVGRTINTDTYTFVALNRWNGFKFQLQSGNLPFYTVKVLRGVGDTTIYDRDDAGIALTNDTWYHVVVAFKSGKMDFYLNGDLVKTWDATTPNPVPGTALTMATPISFIIGQDLPTSKYLTVDGDYQVAWGGFFTGDMDDVMFYNIALDGPQVKSIYTNQKTL
jgi:hypothetical protein